MSFLRALLLAHTVAPPRFIFCPEAKIWARHRAQTNFVPDVAGGGGDDDLLFSLQKGVTSPGSGDRQRYLFSSSEISIRLQPRVCGATLAICYDICHSPVDAQLRSCGAGCRIPT